MFLFFISFTSILTNIAFIIIFILRKNHLDKVEKYGKWVFVLIIPGILSVIFSILEEIPPNQIILLVFFFLFFGIEFIYDHWLKLDFRSNWKLLTPYLILYYIMNYALVVLPWSYSVPIGIICLCLFIIQIGINLWTHKK